MDVPSLLLVLLALPFAVAAAIVAVSATRRRRQAAAHRDADEPVHRLQTDTAVEQDAAVHPAAVVRKSESGRERRARTSASPEDG